MAALGRLAAALPLDVAHSNTFPRFAEQVAALLEQKWRTNAFDFLINNAGVGIYVPFASTTEEQFDELMRIHLKATERRPHSQCLHVSTGLARSAIPGYSDYAAMKGGVEVLTRYLAKELGPDGITVNVLAPGAIATDFAGGVVRDNEGLNQMLAAQTALGRVGLPDDIGGAMPTLLAPESKWINGQRIEVSGGMFL